ncbi:heavy metal translocating P-type ATPase [Azotobacter bryophylli]|uniref:P-type Zn(2+) transporter n=1 Tax=Azotobacter bryophylli TaxID=1986537 RepID=A0ABV7AU40_9GAMM
MRFAPSGRDQGAGLSSAPWSCVGGAAETGESPRAGGWFTGLETLHRVSGRVRYRYRCRPGAPQDRHSIEREVGCLAGVRRVRANPPIRSLVVEFAPQRTDADALAGAIRALSPPGLPPAAEHDENSRLGVAVLSGAVLFASRGLERPLQAPAAVCASLPLLGEALADLFARGITSHVLEALAVGISIGRGDFLAANITTFLLALGGYLEASIERRSDDMLKHLLRPSADRVWVERHGAETLIDAAAVRVGDRVIAATGTTIPVDGTVLGGEALVNEATMTGESVPVRRRRGDRVLSATLVEEGRLRIHAERVGQQSAAARIADFVGQSLALKSRTQLEAARLADRLVPLVLGLAGTVGLLTVDGQRVAAVLQADYSCALRLATPVAFKAAMARAGRSAILIRSAKALEELAWVDTLVFDKTGTLTTGVLQVTDAIAFSPAYSAEDLTNLAASLEEHYVHPIARAVVEAARGLGHPRHFAHRAVQFVVAHGVASAIGGRRIVVGSRHFVEEDEGISTAAHAGTIERLRGEGKTLLYVGFGGELIGLLGMTERLRDNAAETLARLRGFGIRRILMFTGDQPERARALAAELDLDGFHAGLLPEQKVELLRGMVAAGDRIAFVGDGMNDAPALSGAQVGIAMHGGADTARLAADVALLEDDLGRVADALALAQATRRLIEGNFWLIASLNTGILGAAGLGLLAPVAASLLHNGSTLAILLRALTGAGLPRRP